MERSWNEDIHCPTDGTPGHLGRNERLDPRDLVGLSETQELHGQHLRPLVNNPREDQTTWRKTLHGLY